MKPTKTLAERRKETDSDQNVVASVEFVLRAELHESVETDFVHSIAGRIIAEPESSGREDAGHIGASLVQFGEALDHGVSAERLGDGLSGDISEYCGHLFDMETGYPKEEIQDEFEVVDLYLLIIDYVAIYPEFRGLGIAESAIHRTIDIFWYRVRVGSVQALAAAVHSVRCERSKSAEKTCATERKQRRGHSEDEIVLVTSRVLAARRHRNLSAERVAKRF
jgi:hypothetical protein